ncbi:uncharacterized protein isoform X2 [Castor canadensis]
MYRQVYNTEQQTVYRCCPAWRQWDDEPGCQHSISALGTHFNGRKYSDGEALWCQCSQGFHGPHCQYDPLFHSLIPVDLSCHLSILPWTHLLSGEWVETFGQDINECTFDNGGCQDQCYNTVGSYYCKCQAGQKLKKDGRACEDIDECAVVNGGCQQRCINTLGTFHCECDTGYRLHVDERTCININACAEELAVCGHRCVNSVGSFTRTCHPGFELGADGKHCNRIELEIVNSCEKNNGGCSHHCEHSIGGPRCSCNHGHQLDSDEKICIELDECENEETCCAQLCINYLGGYKCSCQEGFQISSDGCGCDALDHEELEEEEELEVVRFLGCLFQNPPQLLHHVAPLWFLLLKKKMKKGEEISKN